MFLRQALTRTLNETDGKGRVLYKLEEDLKWSETFDSGGTWLHVPKGFVTNLGSTPRWSWSIFPPAGRWNSATIAHDYLCTLGYDRFLADAHFRYFMKRLGVPWWRRVTAYYAVRIASLLTGKG